MEPDKLLPRVFAQAPAATTFARDVACARALRSASTGHAPSGRGSGTGLQYEVDLRGRSDPCLNMAAHDVTVGPQHEEIVAAARGHGQSEGAVEIRERSLQPPPRRQHGQGSYARCTAASLSAGTITNASRDVCAALRATPGTGRMEGRVLGMRRPASGDG